MGTYPEAVSNPYKCNKGLRECRGRLPVMCMSNHLVSAEAFPPRSEYRSIYFVRYMCVILRLFTL